LKFDFFTQDLAQELDKESRAVDLVTSYACDGTDGDIAVSDEDARNVMGRLGLGGEKPLRLRKISALRGGEKARVALSMFALKASNLLLMLGEPCNVSVIDTGTYLNSLSLFHSSRFSPPLSCSI